MNFFSPFPPELMRRVVATDQAVTHRIRNVMEFTNAKTEQMKTFAFPPVGAFLVKSVKFTSVLCDENM